MPAFGGVLAVLWLSRYTVLSVRRAYSLCAPTHSYANGIVRRMWLFCPFENAFERLVFPTA